MAKKAKPQDNDIPFDPTIKPNQPTYGHNSGGVNGTALKQYIERAERLEEDRRAVQEDIKDVFAEAKANGFDVKIMRKVIAIRKRERSSVEEEVTLTDLYMAALGDMPLFKGEAE